MEHSIDRKVRIVKQFLEIIPAKTIFFRPWARQGSYWLSPIAVLSANNFRFAHFPADSTVVSAIEQRSSSLFFIVEAGGISTCSGRLIARITNDSRSDRISRRRCRISERRRTPRFLLALSDVLD